MSSLKSLFVRKLRHFLRLPIGTRASNIQSFHVSTIERHLLWRRKICNIGPTQIRLGKLDGLVVMNGIVSNDPKCDCSFAVIDGVGFIGMYHVYLSRYVDIGTQVGMYQVYLSRNVDTGISTQVGLSDLLVTGLQVDHTTYYAVGIVTRLGYFGKVLTK